MTKILHIVNSNVLNGGIGTVLSYLDKGLNKRSYSSSVMKTYASEMGKFGYEALKGREFDSFTHSRKDLQDTLSEQDILHVHGVPSYRMLEALDALRREGRCPKVVNTCHSSVKKELSAHLERCEDANDRTEIEKMIENGMRETPARFVDTYWGSAIHRQGRVMEVADVVQHMNGAYKDEIIAEYAARDAGKHVVVYNGVDIIPEVTARPKKKRVLYSGRFAHEKGIDEFIEALPSILTAHPDTEVKIAGGDRAGITVDKYKKKAEALFQREFGRARSDKHLDRITFTGWVDSAKMADNYDWCDFLVVPSKDESFCLAIAEALNHERIPIMTRTPALHELYLSHGAGIGIKPEMRNPRGIAETVGWALDSTDPELLDLIAKTGRRLVAEKYSLNKVMEEQMHVYEKLRASAATSSRGFSN